MKWTKLLAICAASIFVFASAPQAKSYGKSTSGYSKSKMPSYGSGSKSSSNRVGGYTKRDGKYVAPHSRSKSDSAVNNNWSVKGNTNPRTGKAGTKRGNPYGR